MSTDPSSLAIVTQTPPVVTFGGYPVNVDLYSERSHLLRQPVSSIETKLSLFYPKATSFIPPACESECNKKLKSFVKILYILPPIVPAISSYLSLDKFKDITLLSRVASWVKVHCPLIRTTFLTFPSPPPTNKKSLSRVPHRIPFVVRGIEAL